MAAATRTRECGRCGEPVEVPAPPEGMKATLVRIWESVIPVCTACSKAIDAEERAEQAERLRAAADARVRASGLPRRLRGLWWDDLDEVAEGREKAIEAARKWAGSEGKPGIYLHGPVGVGKTRIAATAVNERIHRGSNVSWASMPVLLARATSDANRERASYLLTAGTRAIALDDVTKIGGSRWAAAQLYAAVDARLSEGTALLLTSQVPPSELGDILPAEFAEALASRIAEGCVVRRVEGPDRRLGS